MSTSKPSTPLALRDLVRAGLLKIGEGCQIHSTAVFLPEDMVGTTRPLVIGDRVAVGAFAILHGGVRIGRQTVVGHGVTIGEPEYGYAVRHSYVGAGATTEIGSDVILRAGAIVYAGTDVGDNSMVGHRALLRTNVKVGSATQLGANLTVERGSTVGNGVRCSPGSHITAETVIEDGVFIGAGVRTINDNELIWRDPTNQRPLSPPTFRRGCKVGSGAVVLAGVDIGRHALVGAGSIVTRDVEAGTVVYGVPAKQHRKVKL